MIKKIAIGAVALVGLALVVILGIAASKPDTFTVERSAVIKASPEKLFNMVNDLHNWKQWSPYEEKDPKMKSTFSGPDKGKGSVYSWDGNDEVGSGSMEIAEVSEPSNVKIDLHFLKPFKGDNKVNFSFVPEGDMTKVTWAMSGDAPFMCKVMQIFCNMDEMCGKDFAKGLAKLKTLTES
jgi:uncharacterized protein YndB with AHSA1/START domain